MRTALRRTILVSVLGALALAGASSAIATTGDGPPSDGPGAAGVAPLSVEDYVEVTPVPPSRAGNELTIPEVVGVTYTGEDGEPVTGTVEIPADLEPWDSLTICAETDAGYIFPGLRPIECWRHFRVDDPSLIVVTGIEPVREGNQLTLPDLEGVTYTANYPAGPVSGAIEISPDRTFDDGLWIQAFAEPGHVFANGDTLADWGYYFIPDPPVVIAAAVPTVLEEAPTEDWPYCVISDKGDTRINAVALPRGVGGGLDHVGWALAAGETFTIYKEPLPGFAFADGSTTSWTFSCPEIGVTEPEPETETATEPAAEPETEAGTESSGVPEPEGETAAPTVQLGSPSVAPGEDLTVTVTGLAAGEAVRIELHSTPVLLGTATADQDGAVVATLTIPADAAPGVHTIVVVGDETYLEVPVRILAVDGSTTASADADAALAETGAAGTFPLVMSIAMILTGVSCLVLRRRAAMA